MLEHDFGFEKIAFPFIVDNSSMIMVRQHTLGVSSAKTEFPILKTHGLSDCVGVTLYDQNNQIAGLLHMDGAAHLRRKYYTAGPQEDIVAMLQIMEKHRINKIDMGSLEAHVTNTSRMRPHTLSFITKEVLIKLGVEKVITVPGPAIAIDARGGEVTQLEDYLPSERYDENSSRILQLAHRHKAVLTSDKRSLR